MLTWTAICYFCFSRLTFSLHEVPHVTIKSQLLSLERNSSQFEMKEMVFCAVPLSSSTQHLNTSVASDRAWEFFVVYSFLFSWTRRVKAFMVSIFDIVNVFVDDGAHSFRERISIWRLIWCFICPRWRLRPWRLSLSCEWSQMSLLLVCRE